MEKTSLAHSVPNAQTIHTIPFLNPDVLLEIFEHASSETLISPGRTEAYTLYHSQVCRSWRALTLSQPRLWSEIKWHDLTILRPADARFTALLDLHLERSKQSLLYVWIRLDEDDPVQIRKHLLDSIFEAQHRIKHLTIMGTKESFPDKRTYLLQSATQLQKLHLDIQTASWSPTAAVTVTVDMSCLHSLKDLLIYGNNCVNGQASTLNSLQLVWSLPGSSSGQHLTASVSCLLSLLRTFPNLRSLWFAIGVEEVVFPFPKRLAMQELRQLTLLLNTGGFETVDSLFRNLELPSLEYLDLTCDDDAVLSWRWRNASVLKSLVSLSLTRVITANIYGHDLDEDEISEGLTSLLQQTPALENLHISIGWISTQILSLLTLGPGADNNVCPELSSLVLESWASQWDPGAMKNITPQAVIDLVSSRWQAPQQDKEEVPSECVQSSGLKRINLCFGMPILPNLIMVEPLRSFIKQGLEVGVSSSAVGDRY
ncbi:hypothetical protein SCHPADRAFT_995397 [Schizopora paradoxa]|uniref:Uncharacterized protein n=1 Tax=Schizopora paradoxa TaxID=27342 RepID=A0A0H2S2P3_9AGAM|nr:hypothetical protein SCHPADRAFT_995397 [Schizopora paradoxa]